MRSILHVCHLHVRPCGRLASQGHSGLRGHAHPDSARTAGVSSPGCPRQRLRCSGPGADRAGLSVRCGRRARPGPAPGNVLILIYFKTRNKKRICNNDSSLGHVGLYSNAAAKPDFPVFSRRKGPPRAEVRGSAPPPSAGGVGGAAQWGPAAAPRPTPGPRAPGGGAQPPCVLSRDVTRIVFSSSGLGALSSALPLHRQEVPAFVSEVLLEGSLPTILGDLGGPQGEGAVRPPCRGSGGPQPALPAASPELPGCASTSGHSRSGGRGSSPAGSTSPEWCWALDGRGGDPRAAGASPQRSLNLDAQA